MNRTGTIADAEARRLAETTFDRHVVVIAGAGTGKTTLLIDRLIRTLMRESAPISIRQVLALTFTNKAAAELRMRLRERLLWLTSEKAAGGERGACPDRQERYGLKPECIVERAKAALGDLEKAQIGTIHSFAAHLLRLYPIESGVDPDFREDDGGLFEEHFAEHWNLWLDRELGKHGRDHERWRGVLAHASLEDLRLMAHALCSELLPLDDLSRQSRQADLSEPLRGWFDATLARTDELAATYDRPNPRAIEFGLAAAREAFRLVRDYGAEGLNRLSSDVKAALERGPGNCPNGWNETDFQDCKSLVRTAHRMLSADPPFMRDLLALLAPFVRNVQETFRRQGLVSFDGLLARARALLRDHPSIRERLKQEYRAILIDEFQDTDPIQYEVMLYLAERTGSCGAQWHNLDLEPGKLFIVGDPKQSIYAFRRADMEAFDRVVDKIAASGGLILELTTNFRSHPAVLTVVNQVFDRLFQRKETVQPANVPLTPGSDEQHGVQCPGVELRLTIGDEEGMDAAALTRAEAENLAGWIKGTLLERETVVGPQGQPIPVKPGHIAILLRKLTQAQEYLDALRRHRIPYMTDGEKHFYRRQEVGDLVNLLRVIENPHDTIALAGVLRSPLGGITDRDLYELRQHGALDYRVRRRLSDWQSPHAAAVGRLYERLGALHDRAPACSPTEVIDQVFSQLPVLELAAASLHGEQAVANLLKVRQIAAELADRPRLTLNEFVRLMIDRLSEQPDEAESALTEESSEAVRILTVHKAKGLEFPIVIVAGLHHGEKTGGREAMVSYDWATGLIGLRIGRRCTLEAVPVSEKLRIREEAERLRVLYVAMTRAKERLILSGGLGERSTSGTFLSLLEEAVGGRFDSSVDSMVRIGSASIPCTVEPPAEVVSPRKAVMPDLRPAPDYRAVVDRWHERRLTWIKAGEIRTHVTPSALNKQQDDRVRTRSRHAGSLRARTIGTLAHRLLENWDFQDTGELWKGRLETLCRGSPDVQSGESKEIEAELAELCSAFAASGFCRRLREAAILGREVPFAIPWEDNDAPAVLRRRSTIMHGVVDLIYRLHGQVWVADYKTDRVDVTEIRTRARDYGMQARVYREAVARCLGLDVREVGFQFVFLAGGGAVTVVEEGLPC